MLSSCSDDSINNIVNETDTSPMWPQLGYDGRHTGNPSGIKADIPSINGQFERIDTISNGQYIHRAPITIDAKGNIYSKGYGQLYKNLYKFDQGGALLWKKDSLEFDGYSTISLSKDEKRLYAVCTDKFLCLDSSGNIIWQHNVGGNSMAVIGKDGTVYYSAYSGFTALSPDGDVKWQISFAIHNFFPSLDRDGNIYLLSLGYVLKYSSNGNLIWLKNYNAYDSFWGTVLVDGYYNLYFLDKNYKLISLDKDGNLRWQNDTVSSWSAPALDNYNNLYTTKGNYIYSFDKEGALRWQSAILPAPESEHIEPYLTTDGSTIYYMTQSSGLATTGAMDSTGILKWVTRTVADPILGGTALSPMGKVIFRPKNFDYLVNIK